MRPTTLLALILATTASACKCFQDGRPTAFSAACCGLWNGKWNGAAQDCEAHSISNRFAGFAGCCRAMNTKSDCGCSNGCG
ncbi:hypothetical protein BU23DRAFT_94649 [Bimuria novae-zelandiae CBS 107.79]|uniref:Extracellular membrane protein CFEM domain-containing protein n=1 Tax=Bimuria novae-zelandiae CBS 107.79 TaxID=1447943 RepID=A0A6A5VDR6_9PLEO|nr:hypothetical protein BU23DRAFT_94649 [Bimuria novae-zelandiae CBS 107.79]